MNKYIVRTSFRSRRRELLKVMTAAMPLPILGLPGRLLAGGSDDYTPSLSQKEINTLTQITRLMFPHEVSMDVYMKVVRELTNKSDSDTLTILKVAVREITGDSVAWLSSSEKEQISQLKKMEDTEFFRVMRKTCIETLYRDPRIWQLIGYEGSAIEYGGYVNRGFNDISWLDSH